MARDFITTRKVFARLDREADLYLVCERLREAVNDIDEKLERLDQRLNALEQERVKFQTESGVHRIIEQSVNKEAVNWGKWIVRGVLGTASAALAGWVLKLAYKGFVS